jgi:hypothetical protein
MPVILPLVLERDSGVCNSIPDWIWINLSPRPGGIRAALSLTILTIGYSAVHLTACEDVFPSHREYVPWGMSAGLATITTLPFVLHVVAYCSWHVLKHGILPAHFCDRYEAKPEVTCLAPVWEMEDKDERDQEEENIASSWILRGFLGLLPGLGGIYLVGKSFLQLRAMTIGVYVNVSLLA